jgi:signal transduction histidine kinase/CheY-like chemotaxis protein/HPt (histidine-containing phosphotransfer) domain-containing protein
MVSPHPHGERTRVVRRPDFDTAGNGAGSHLGLADILGWRDVASPIIGRVRAAQIQTVLSFTPLTMITNLVNVGVIAWVVHAVAHPFALALWALTTMVLALAGLRAWQTARRRPAPKQASLRTIRRATRKAALLGLMWALVPAVWFAHVDHAGQLLIATLSTGMICAGGFALATIPSAAVIYVVILTIGAFFGAARTGDLSFVALAILLAAYSLIVIRSVLGTAKLFVERFATEAALIERGEVIDLLLHDFEENGSDWLFQIDRNHKILSATSRFASVVGTPDILGKDLLGFVAPSHRETLRDALALRCAFRDLEVAVEVGGTPRWWSLSAGPIVEDRKFLGYRGVGSDVTQRRRAEEERREALAEASHHRRLEELAEAQNKAKSNILAVMSHEIRTPMNAVIGLTASLIETKLDSEQRHLVHTIHESSNSLLHLLNDILDFSKLEAGKIAFEVLPFAPAALIGQVADVMDAHAAEKGLTLRTVIDQDLPAAVIGDRTRLRQVLLNLASNAVKFTESGSVEIAARYIGTAGGNPRMAFSVRDTGMGIEPRYLDRLFSDFTQGDSSISRRFGGTGLGLAICKRIVEQMGGEIRVESELGRGSVFIVTLSLPLADAAAPEVGALPADDAVAMVDDGEPLSILLAEDNATNQLVFSKLTQGLNARITIAANGREALEHAERGSFDVVFMDMRMPEMDGLAATRAIRALGGAWSTIPIIALTANAFAEDVKSCRDAGMDDFIAKPIRKTVLVQTLSVLRAGRKPASGSTGAAPAAPAEAPVLDRASLDTLIGEIERDGVVLSFEAFFADAAERLTTLAGLSCGTHRAWIRDEAHALKGAAGTLGFARLAALARTLEQTAPAITPIVYADLLSRMNACFAETKAEADRAIAA